MTTIQRAALVVMLALVSVPVHAQDPPRTLANYLVPQDVPRFALVIGVEHYDNFDHVPNALNDLETAGSALERAGFTTIRRLPDATMRAVFDGLKEITQLVEGHERPAIVVVFFAGHGFQDREVNYIVPKNASRESLIDDSIPISSIIVKLAPRRAGLAIFFLDACRTLNSLLPDVETAEGPMRSHTGFWPVNNFDGAVLGFGPGFNQPALSRAHLDDQNSPYTTALKMFLNIPALSMSEMFGEIYTFVKLVTQERQQPEVLVRARVDKIGFMPKVSPEALLAEESHWRATLDTNRYDCVKAFTVNYPDSRFTNAALRWIAEIPPGVPTTGGGIGCPTR